MKPVSNPFNEQSAAQRYNRYRPQYHSIPFAKLGALIGSPASHALDVACGTGHSTIALSKLSKHVIGCDLSASMLEEARKHSSLEFVESPAEKLPFESHSFDLLNISSAIHWVDQPTFLREAARVLRHDGYLSIDNQCFTGVMKDVPEFTDAHREFYSANLSQAARHQRYPSDELLADGGFRLVADLPYDYEAKMTLDSFANYVMSQSNFLSLPESSQPEVAAKISRVYKPYFAGSERLLMFKGLLKVYRSV